MPIPKIEPIKLSKEAVQDLQDMGENLIILKAEIERAERAGIDVEALKKRLEETTSLRVGLLKEYT